MTVRPFRNCKGCLKWTLPPFEIQDRKHTHTFGSDSRFILYGWVFPPSDESGDHNLISDLHKRRNTTPMTTSSLRHATPTLPCRNFLETPPPPDFKIPFLLAQTYVSQPVRYLLNFYLSAANPPPTDAPTPPSTSRVMM